MPSPQNEKSISLALVTYNQGHYLKGFLDQYLLFGFGLIPLIIIDDGSTDDTKGILNPFRVKTNCNIITSTHMGIAHARNLALNTCGTTWIAFSDTDCFLDKNYFETIITIPDKYGGALAIEGAIHSPPGPIPPFSHSLTNIRGGIYATANMIFHVPSALKYGGFDEQFKNYREDVDLALTLKEKSGSIPFCETLIVQHPNLRRTFINSFRSTFRKQIEIIRSELLLYHKHPLTYQGVRFHGNAKETILSWVLKTAPQKLKMNCLYWKQYLFSANSTGIFTEINYSFAAIIQSIWEQFCIVIIIIFRLHKPSESNSNLKSKLNFP